MQKVLNLLKCHLWRHVKSKDLLHRNGRLHVACNNSRGDLRNGQTRKTLQIVTEAVIIP